MSPPWSPVQIVSGDEMADEPLGTKQKFWVEAPGDDRLWLFKFARRSQGRTLGEDWAEWLVHHLGELIGVPTAEIRPATCDGRRGVVSRSVIDSVAVTRLVHGNSLLSEFDAAYDASLKRENPRYTVESVRSALEEVSAPAEFAGPTSMGGFDVWVGYLVLDAWVAGRDRHHENWGVLSTRSSRSLAPSFDHGNALGFQERVEQVLTMNASRDLTSNWLARGRSHHFAGRPALIDLARRGLRLASADAREYWHHRVRSIDLEAAGDIVQSVPREIMSDPAHTFAMTILTENQKRILHDYPDQ